MQAIFLRLLKGSGDKSVALQLLQSTNMLLHNLNLYETKSSFYPGSLLMMPIYEELLLYPFDFSDDEICGNYVSLLRGITTNLPEDLLLKFLVTRDFSLFSCTRMFCFYKETMVRTASRTALLTIIRCRATPVREYVLSSGFLLTLVLKAKENLYEINSALEELAEFRVFQSLVADTVDILFYLQDILHEGIEGISGEIQRGIMTHIVHSAVIPSLVKSKANRLSQRLCLFVLSQMITIFTHSETVNSIVSCLFGGRSENANELHGQVQGNSLRQILLSILSSADEELLSLCLHLIQSILNNENISQELLLEIGLFSPGKDNQIVRSLFKTLTHSQFTLQTTHLLLRTANSLVNQRTEPEYKEILQTLMKQHLTTAETLINAKDTDPKHVELFEEEYENMKKLSTKCPKVSLERLYTPPALDHPSTLRQAIHLFLLCLKTHCSFHDCGINRAICPLTFSKVPLKKSLLAFYLAPGPFRVLFTRITHTSDMRNLSLMDGILSKHLIIASGDYSKITVLFDGIC